MEQDPRNKRDPEIESQWDERDDINWEESDERSSCDKPHHFERSSHHQPNHEVHRDEIYSSET